MTNIPKARDLGVRAASASGAALIALLLPKCPLCVAAFLAAAGASASVAQGAAALVRPAAFTVAAIALLAFAIGTWRRRRARAAHDCCGHYTKARSGGGHRAKRARKVHDPSERSPV
jgi:hypothetical protein